jgi:hypothetical protein
MGWHAFEKGKSVDHAGSEGGIIIRDEEHDEGARMTLERGGQVAPFAVTCGIYGWMVHTRFFGTESEAQSEFESMKVELSKIIATIPRASDPHIDSKARAVSESLSEFVRRFP